MNLKVTHTYEPNGRKKVYRKGMKPPVVKPSNHPDVLAMRWQRVSNEIRVNKS